MPRRTTTMKHHHTKKRKKKRSPQPPPPPPPPPPRASMPAAEDGALNRIEEEESKAVVALMEAFDSVCLEEASSALKEANGDVEKAEEILANWADSAAEYPLSTCSGRSGISTSDSGSGSSSSSSWGSSSGSSVGFLESNLGNGMGRRGNNKQQKRMAVTGTVSTVLGKDYVKASPRRGSAKGKELVNGVLAKEEAEQFLCSMLGDDCEISMAVVRDVLCQCGYNVEKALDTLLDLSASSDEHSRINYDSDIVNCKRDARSLFEHSDSLAARSSKYTSYSSDSELHDNIWGYGCRNYWEALTGTEAPLPTSLHCNESDLPQKLLESLFNIPKSSEHEPTTMNWKNVVKKMQSLGPRVNVCPSSVEGPHPNTHAKGNEYGLFRESAKQHWDSTRSYYQNAATAYSRGQRAYAAYLSDQGRLQTKLAQVADEKASQDIFKARNKGIENVITIDLHGQHVKEAMRLLKVHLLFGKYVNSIQTLRVITGSGGHGVGKSKVKQSVINLLEKERIEWKEENRGTLLIKLDGYEQCSFLESESDSE